ncbi:hypothetical protein OSTOST_01906 [Ostertagia ostertagi]
MSYVLALRPNVPIQLPSITTTLSVLSWQYFKLLEATFVRRKNATALWTPSKSPLLQCSSKEKAKSLQCSLLHSCDCTPAESQVTCRCENQDIAEEFHQIGNVLPVTYPFVKMANHPHHDVIAHIEHGVTAELVVNVNETVDNIVTEVTDEVCYIANTHIYGCYSCKEGARAKVTCFSSGSTFAELDCGTETFTIPCSPMKEESTLRFLISNAQVQLKCSVACGKSPTYEINGILKYVHSLHDGLKQFVKERILSAVQGMAMCNETYGLLILANVETEKSKEKFYDQRPDGIPLEPAFVNEFVGKEIDFLDELLRNIDTELHEASHQIANEDHGSIYENVLQIMAQFQKSMDQLDKSLNSQLQQHGETLARLDSSMEAIQKEFEGFRSMTKSVDEVNQEEANEDTQSKRSDDGILEDLWEVGTEDATPPSENDKGKTHEESRKEQGEDGQNKECNDDGQDSETERIRNRQRRRRKITERMEKILRKISDRRLPPKRIFTIRNQMRKGEKFLKCSFCNVKGLHYSDSCPEYRSVEDRTERIRCKLCLDTKHRTKRCKKDVHLCKYCQSARHHTALFSSARKM